MTRYNDKSSIEKQWLTEFSASLKRIAAMIDGNVDSMARMELDAVQATHFKSAEGVPYFWHSLCRWCLCVLYWCSTKVKLADRMIASAFLSAIVVIGYWLLQLLRLTYAMLTVS